MMGRLGGLRYGVTHVLVLGVLGGVTALATLGREVDSDFTAAPDDPNHASHCSVCRSPNHFGGLMPGPAPSNETLSRMISDDLDGEVELGDVQSVSEDEMIETANNRKVHGLGELPKVHRSFEFPQPRTNVRRPSAS
jgi:hypothetical protein